MEKREIINAIEWRKNFIARLFCKHKYGEYEIHGKDVLLPLNGHYVYYICEKCGHYKDYELLHYPWE